MQHVVSIVIIYLVSYKNENSTLFYLAIDIEYHHPWIVFLTDVHVDWVAIVLTKRTMISD